MRGSIQAEAPVVDDGKAKASPNAAAKSKKKGGGRRGWNRE